MNQTRTERHFINKKNVTRLLFITSLVFFFSCTSKKSNEKSFSHRALKLLKVQHISGVIPFNNSKVGGFSGIAFDQKNNLFHVVSDDKGDYGLPRVFQFKLNLQSLTFSPEKVVLLKNQDGIPFKDSTIDPEGIVLIGENGMLISNEGMVSKEKIYPPSIIEFNKNGNFINEIKLPEYFHPNQEKSKGIRFNSGPEALGLTPDSKNLFIGFEESLIQDGPEASTEKESLVRVLKYKHSQSGFSKEKEYMYPLGPIPNPNAHQSFKAGIGLVEILPISDNKSLFMERSFSYSHKETTIQIFKVIFNNDIKLKKELIIDLSHFKNQFPSHIQIDNFEGMSWGPILENGNKTLVLVSDNNFSLKQKNLILLFEVLKDL